MYMLSGKAANTNFSLWFDPTGLELFHNSQAIHMYLSTMLAKGIYQKVTIV